METAMNYLPVKTSIDITTGQRSFFLDSSTFFSNRLAYCFDSNFKILTRVFFLFVNIYFANLDSCFLLHSMYFTSFDLSIMFSTCFYYRYNFVRNGTPYPTFALGQLENLSFFIKNHTYAEHPAFTGSEHHLTLFNFP